jgi:hypothetical protein
VDRQPKPLQDIDGRSRRGIKIMAREKGTGEYQRMFNIMVTKEQHEFLKTIPNASKFIRDLIDESMKEHEEDEAKKCQP